MFHWLLPIFSAICGENPQHIWAPGGQPLPCCERCTGLYIGALLAAVAQIWFQPVPSRRYLQIHALCLLQLGLFIFPWLPDWAALRSLSGSLFGFGVVAYLWPAVSQWRTARKNSRLASTPYALTLIAIAVLIPAIAQWGGQPGAYALMCLILAGLLVLATLVTANLALISRSVATLCRPAKTSGPAA